MPRAARLLLKSVLWLLAAPLFLLLLAIGWIGYTVASFDTETLPGHYGQVGTQLYARAGASRPLIVGLGGAEGGNAWTRDFWKPQRDRFLDQGYAFLAIGYFGMPDTPKQLDRIALEGVHAAIEAAQRDPSVQSECVIVMGGSKGAELALALAAHYPDIDAVVAMAPSDVVFPGHTDAFTTSSWAIDRKPLPFVPMPWSATWDLINGRIGAVMSRMLEDEPAVQAAMIPSERIHGPVLLISAKDDEYWPATRMSERLMQRLDAAGFAHAHEHLVVEGTHIDSAKHFDKVEEFLGRVVATRPGCAPVP
jgi:uncharacterized protein